MNAKRHSTGCYEYKGYSITFLPPCETGCSRGHWIIGNDDAAQTKKEAMLIVDQYEKKGIAPSHDSNIWTR